MAGDFNDWADHAARRRAAASSRRPWSWPRPALPVPVPDGDGRWFNDEEADDYEPNEFGGMNCVVDLTE